MRNYEPNGKIVDRAVEIWKRLLKDPKYDNLGKDMRGMTFEEAMPNLMASAIAKKISNNATPEMLDKFGEALKKKLMTPNEKWGSYISYLCVDYNADKTLTEAADEVGLQMEFPWKTSMSIYSNYLAVGSGYAAPFVYHYPISNNRWLMTTLHGQQEDINKIIKLAEDGCNMFEIEEPTPI